ncbi:MAG: hypothetical protein LBI91_07595, partial [Spirochaetaceae bacterium]|nr:hypothetical protein [Spirochaetaceae bacterium]
SAPVCLIPHNQFAFRYSDHAPHGIAFSSLTGIAGGLRNIMKERRKWSNMETLFGVTDKEITEENVERPAAYARAGRRSNAASS